MSRKVHRPEPTPKVDNARDGRRSAGSGHERWLATLRTAFEQEGTRAPLLTAVVFCERFKLRVPAWARLGLAKGFAIHLGFWEAQGEKWTPDPSGAVLGRKQISGRRLKKSPAYASLDAVLGIYGKNSPKTAGLRLNEYVSRFESGLLPEKKKGYRSNLESLASKSGQENDISQVRHIQAEAHSRGEKITEKAAVYELAKRRDQNDAKFYSRFKQYKRNLKGQ